MICNPQRIQDDLVQDTVILTRLSTPRIRLETWLQSWKEGDSGVCLQDWVLSWPVLPHLSWPICGPQNCSIWVLHNLWSIYSHSLYKREIPTALQRSRAKRNYISCLHLPRKMWHRSGSAVTDFSWHFRAHDKYLKRRRKAVGPQCGKKWALNHTSTYRLIQQQQQHCTEQSGAELCKQGGSNGGRTWCLGCVDSREWKGPCQQESPGRRLTSSPQSVQSVSKPAGAVLAARAARSASREDVAEDHLVSANRNPLWEPLTAERCRERWTSRGRVQILSTARAAVTQTLWVFVPFFIFTWMYLIPGLDNKLWAVNSSAPSCRHLYRTFM